MLGRRNLSFKLSKSKKKSVTKWSKDIRFEDGKEYKNFRASDIVLGEMRGKGIFGAVFEAIHKKSGKKIAVKKILSHDTTEERFKKELEITRRIDAHDSIVHFYGLTFEEGDCYICMELMDVDLKCLYKYFSGRSQLLSDNFIAAVAASVVDGLQYLKDKYQVMHRDVKPSNILLDRKGYAKLCDFGVSGYLIRSLAQTNVGTAAYLAPERIESCGPYTVAADVWSLGITLFEVATGAHPYEKHIEYTILSEIARNPPPQLDDSCGRSKELKDFINCCLTKDCENRPKYDKLMMTALYAQAKANSLRAAGIVGECVEEYLNLQNPSR